MAKAKKTIKGHKPNGHFDFDNKGRGKKWETPEELQEEIDQYFQTCDQHTVEEFLFGKIQEVKKPRPYLIEGLCVSLEVGRKTLLNYEKREGYEPFFHVIKKAKQKRAG